MRQRLLGDHKRPAAQHAKRRLPARPGRSLPKRSRYQTQASQGARYQALVKRACQAEVALQEMVNFFMSDSSFDELIKYMERNVSETLILAVLEYSRQTDGVEGLIDRLTGGKISSAVAITITLLNVLRKIEGERGDRLLQYVLNLAERGDDHSSLFVSDVLTMPLDRQRAYRLLFAQARTANGAAADRFNRHVVGLTFCDCQAFFKAVETNEIDWQVVGSWRSLIECFARIEDGENRDAAWAGLQALLNSKNDFAAVFAARAILNMAEADTLVSLSECIKLIEARFGPIKDLASNSTPTARVPVVKKSVAEQRPSLSTLLFLMQASVRATRSSHRYEMEIRVLKKIREKRANA